MTTTKKLESSCGAGELEYLKTCAWSSDLDQVVLEMPNENGKGTMDAEISTLRSLLHEMEEEEVVDCTINGHECERAPACGEGAAAPESDSLSCFMFVSLSPMISCSRC